MADHLTKIDEAAGVLTDLLDELPPCPPREIARAQIAEAVALAPQAELLRLPPPPEPEPPTPPSSRVRRDV